MAQQDYSTRRQKFQHLTEQKRAQIEILLKMKVPKSRIAREVGIACSTLYNELARGSVEQLDTHLRTYNRYFRDAGQRMYEEHRRNSRPPLKLAKVYDFIAYAEKRILVEKLAPDTIRGEVRRSGCFPTLVCAKTLYNSIDQCLLKVRNIDLLLKVKRKLSGSGHHQHKRLYGMSIEQCPEKVNNREEFGHWEIDTVVGNTESSAVLLTLDERKCNPTVSWRVGLWPFCATYSVMLAQTSSQRYDGESAQDRAHFLRLSGMREERQVHWQPRSRVFI